MVSDPEYSGRSAARRYGLNPCSNGIWSLTLRARDNPATLALSLNPCSNGIWSLTLGDTFKDTPEGVLILVLMEYGL